MDIEEEKRQQELIDIQKELEAKFDELFASLDEGEVSKPEKDFGQGEESDTLSKSIRRQLEEEYGKLEDLAEDKYQQREHREELSLWQQALEVAQQLNDTEKEIRCSYKICQDYMHLGYYKDALLTSFQVTKFYTAADPLDLYWTVTRQLQIAEALVIPRDCLERILAQMKFCMQKFRLEEQAGYLLDEACLYLDYCMLEKALAKAQRSMILRMGDSGGYNLPSHYRCLFLCYYMRNDLELMKKTFAELQHCETSAEASKEDGICFCRSLLCYMQGDYQSAYESAVQMLSFCRKRSLNTYMRLYFLITIAAAWGRPQKAREYLIELIEEYRAKRKNDKRYWQRYYLYRGLGHFYASYSKTGQDKKLASKYKSRSFLYYNHAMDVAGQIDYLLCISGWQQKVQDDLKSLKSDRLPKPFLCDR